MVTLIAVLLTGLSIAGATYLIWLRANPHGEETSLSTQEALARARTSAGTLSDYELMMLKKPRTTLDNATVLKLWKAEVGTEVILQMIRTSNPDYDVSSNAVIQLKQAGVDQTLILAMIDASYSHVR